MDPPAISAQPQAVQQLASAGPATLSATVTGSTPLTYKWTKAGVTNVWITTVPSLVINSPVTTNSGIYTLTVTNQVGKVVSSTAALSIYETPTLTTNLTNSVVAAGSNYTFRVGVAYGTNSLLGFTYAWYHNGILVQGAHTNNLPIVAAKTSDSGFYQVVVANGGSLSVTGSANLTVLGKPVITAQPASSVTVSNGSPVTLSVTATGDALVYQWRKALKTGTGYTNIAGANTNTYTISAVSTSDAGSYSVVITNLVGSVTSTKAAVIVIKNMVTYKDDGSSSDTADSSDVAGDYAGLFVAANGVPADQTSGLLALTITANNSLSGKLYLGGDVIVIAGQLKANDSFVAQFARPGKTPVTVNFIVNTATSQLTGNVSATGWSSTLTADRSVFSASNPAPMAGTYGLIIPATEPVDGLSGSGSLLVSATGTITFVGQTTDGKSISQSTFVSKDGYWAFYAPYADGELIGWLQFINGKPVGTLNWINRNGVGSTVSEVVGSGYSQ
jgi:hypothetical protein